MKTLGCLRILLILSFVCHGISIQSQVILTKKKSGFGVDFDISMMTIEGSGYKPEDVERNNTLLKICKYLYGKNVIRDLKFEQKALIPKIIHQIWIGSKPYPEQFRVWGQTFIEVHNARVIHSIDELDPTADYWQYILWTNDLVATIKLENQLLFDTAKNIGTKADMLRYELLKQFGGVYADTDVQCIQPLDIFLHAGDFIACIAHDGANLENAVIASQAHHPIITMCVDQLKNADPTCEGGKVVYNTGPIFLTQCFLKAIGDCHDYRPIILPSTYFYPRIPKIESYLIHYWYGTWHEPWKL